MIGARVKANVYISYYTINIISKTMKYFGLNWFQIIVTDPLLIICNIQKLCLFIIFLYSF